MDKRILTCVALMANASSLTAQVSSTEPFADALAGPRVPQPAWQSENAEPQDDERVAKGALILAGTFGAIGGLYLGAWTGFILVRNGVIGCNCGEDPGLGGAVTGAVFGSGVLSALATGLGNGGRGGLGKSLGKNLLVSGGVLAVAYETHAWNIVLLAPIIHVTLAVWAQVG